MSPTTSKILLIIGAGPNVGQHVAKVFASKGYKIATSARKPQSQLSEDTFKGDLYVQADMADPSSVAGLFAKVKEGLGVPTVVVYNGMPYM